MTPVDQFRAFIVRPVLEHLQLWSASAEDLVVGTALVESGGLRFFEQVTGKDDRTLGPALGFFQMEPATHDDIWATFLRYRDDLARRVEELIAPLPNRHLQLATNIAYGTAMCRLKYLRARPLLPAAGNVEGYALYWKTHYNTALGAGRPADFLAAYRRAYPEV